VGDLDRLEQELGDARALVAGDTDSERFFATITKAIREHRGDVRAGIVSATRHLADEIQLYSLNFILATEDELWALRYPEHNELFLLERTPGGAQGGHHLDEASAHGTLRLVSGEGVDRRVVVVASEPMDENPGWNEIESGELLHVGPDLRVRRELILPDPPAKPMQLKGRAARSQAQERD
jgi:predicted glutamine amidotransferase